MTGLMRSLSIMTKTGWIGLEHLPTTGVMVLTLTGHSWTGMMSQTGMTMVDNWTWSTGSDPTGTSALSQPKQAAASSSTAASSTSFTGQTATGQTTPNVSALHPTVNGTDLETGETMTYSPVSVIAVMNSLGRPQGLPLIPETVSSPV